MRNVIKLSDSDMAVLKAGQLIINGKKTPGRVYQFDNNGEIVSAKCSQWFGVSEYQCRSHFNLVETPEAAQ